MDIRRSLVLRGLCLCLVLTAGSLAAEPPRDARPRVTAKALETRLLIVGGNEAAVAAAVQAARSGVERITLVSDIDWLGGQFSAEAVGAIDEWTIYRGKRVNFARSGMFLEVIERVRAQNQRQYGRVTPGNAVTASDTIEPAAAAAIFEQLLKPHGPEGTRQIEVIRGQRPIAAQIDERAAVITFESTQSASPKAESTATTAPPLNLQIKAELVIDCSDWGDVVRLSGAAYFAGADARAQFNEPSAPTDLDADAKLEMNPISYCLVVREHAEPQKIERPPHYDERLYLGATNTRRGDFTAMGWPAKTLFLNVPAFVDSAYPEGMYSPNQSVYTQRRLVDRAHNGLPAGTECILLNWVAQDYPLYDFSQRVVDALEHDERGASRKNIVDMTYTQRELVFADAKQHSLGLLYFLQTLADPAVAERFQRLRLVDDFGTADHLPPKPYVREGLRLHALSMLREQDIRTPHKEPRWARVMPPDALFGFQFNIDFHPTRRQFLQDDPAGPWMLIHTTNRNWSTHTDRAMLSARSLVPIQQPRLLGCSKNIGLTSITSAALRLHGQMMLTGQATGALAARSLELRQEPRQVVADFREIERLQRALVTGGPARPGVLLWPYQDLSCDAPHFIAANLLTAWRIWTPDDDSVDFDLGRPHVTERQALTTLQRAIASLDRAAESNVLSATASDIPLSGKVANDWWQTAGFNDPRFDNSQVVTRQQFVVALWKAIEQQPRRYPDMAGYLGVAHDADGDAIPDRDDPLPYDRDNDGVPDLIDNEASALK